MKINFIYMDDLIDLFKRMDIKEIYSFKPLKISNKLLNDVKAVTFSGSGDIYINLSASQWKDIKYRENIFIRHFTKTITHEIIHSILGEKYDNISTEIGQEKVCRLMAEQAEIKYRKI